MIRKPGRPGSKRYLCDAPNLSGTADALRRVARRVTVKREDPTQGIACAA